MLYLFGCLGFCTNVFTSKRKCPIKPAYEEGVNHKIYNIGNTKSIRLLDFINLLEINFQKQATKYYLPMQVADLKDTCADMNDFVIDFDYKPETSIEKGINLFTDWYKSYYSQNSFNNE